jgi:glycosyltransferase involved in cell wall biosynthesis
MTDNHAPIRASAGVSAAPSADNGTMVSVIVPARNEEAVIAACVESLVAQREIIEVIVVNDQSSDRTAEIVRQLAARHAKLRLLETDGPPQGWVGKNHAVAIGAREAKGEWLLFTDADALHLAGSTAQALQKARESSAALVSFSPEQTTRRWYERALIPFVYCRLAAKFSFARVNDPARSDAAANGQFVLVLRDAYEAVGGHAAVARELLEDVALARLVKRSGCGIYFTAPMGVVRTRMYRSFGAMWQGWTKNLYPLVGGNPSALFFDLIEALPFAEVGFATIALLHFAGVKTFWLAPALGACIGALLARYLAYAAALYRNLYPTRYIQYYSVSAALYCAVLIESWWKSTRGKVVWKGREYAAKTP